MARTLQPWPRGLSVVEADAGEFAEAINALNQSEQVPPWCSYVLMEDERPVAMGGFKGAPTDGAVEFGYLTFTPHRGKGHATALAKGLVDIARQEGQRRVIGDTEPDINPSTAILKRLGFKRTGTILDEDIGEAWRWTLEFDQ